MSESALTPGKTLPMVLNRRLPPSFTCASMSHSTPRPGRGESYQSLAWFRQGKRDSPASFPKADLLQLFLEIGAGDQRDLVHGRVLGRLLAGGHPLEHHPRGFVPFDVRTWQHRAEESAVGLFQLTDGVGAVDADADDVRRVEPGALGSPHAAQYGAIVHTPDDEVFGIARQLDHCGVGRIHGPGNIEALLRREDDVV